MWGGDVAMAADGSGVQYLLSWIHAEISAEQPLGGHPWVSGDNLLGFLLRVYVHVWCRSWGMQHFLVALDG